MRHELCPGSIAVVGATGAVGLEALGILAGLGVPAARVRALASERSVGGTMAYGSGKLSVQSCDAHAFSGVSAALFCATSDVARELAPAALAAGAVVVDNSSAFRMLPQVPLVIPEVNGELVRAGGAQIVANPNCSTVILLMALSPLRRAFGVEAVDVATYQAVSGAGQAAIDELHGQVRAWAGGHEVQPRVFREPCAFNVFSHDSAVNPRDGLNGEERKIIDESRKIWRDDRVRITPTCVRVPVVRAHTQAITVELSRAATETEVRAALAGAAGVTIVDDRVHNRFPTPLRAAGGNDVLVGRIRPDPGELSEIVGRYRRWCLLVSADQLRKGAAWNAVQIAALAGCIPELQVVCVA